MKSYPIRIIVTIAVLLVAMMVMVYLYFSNLNKSTGANDLSLNAVASNTGIVFAFDHDKSFYDILSRQDLFQLLLGKNKTDQFSAIKNQLIDRQEFSAFLANQKIYIGFLPSTNGEIDYLIGTQLKESINLEQLITTYLPKQIKVSPLKNSLKLTFSDSAVVYIGLKDKLLMLAPTDQQIERIFKSTPFKESSFAAYMKENTGIAKNSLANVYINFEQLSPLLKQLLNSSLTGELNVFNQQHSYATLNYNFSSEKLLFNGLTTLGTEHSYYNLFSSLPDQKITVNNLLPKTTANYTIYAIADYKSWLPNLGQWLKQQKGNEKILKIEQTVSAKYGLDLKQIFPIYFKNQFITFQLASGEKFGGIALSNGEKVAQQLLDLSADYAPDIKIFREPGIPYLYFGEPFKKFDKPYYTIIDNYLVMSNYASSIQVFLNSYRNDNLLINDGDYQRFNDQLSGATISFYVNHKNSNTIFGRNLKAPYFKHYQSSKGLGKFDAFSYQLTGDKGKFLSNVLIAKKQDKLTDTIAR